jgi:hypothetical protein
MLCIRQDSIIQVFPRLDYTIRPLLRVVEICRSLTDTHFRVHDHSFKPGLVPFWPRWGSYWDASFHWIPNTTARGSSCAVVLWNCSSNWPLPRFTNCVNFLSSLIAFIALLFARLFTYCDRFDGTQIWKQLLNGRVWISAFPTQRFSEYTGQKYKSIAAQCLQTERILPWQRILLTVKFPKQPDCCDARYNSERRFSISNPGDLLRGLISTAKSQLLIVS